MISVAIQGGAMRSIYCLGAVRALVDSQLATEVRTIHTASAGCVAAAVLANQIVDDQAPPVGEVGEALLDRLATTKFIDQRRIRKIVDVDYLVSTMQEKTPLVSQKLAAGGILFEVALTDAVTAAAEYVNLSQSVSAADVTCALRATMAIPVLYPYQVKVNGRRYLDGGIVDPLPVMRALENSPDLIVAIASVPAPTLADVAEGREAVIVKYFPGLSSPVRNLMLTRNPLADAASSVLRRSEISGTKIIYISPSDPTVVSSRTELNKGKLQTLEALGYRDGIAAFKKAGYSVGDTV